MNYYIHQNNTLHQVSSHEYDHWISRHKEDVNIKTANFTTGNITYQMQSQYYGAFEEHEEILPFILLTYHTHPDGSIGSLDNTQYFATLADMCDTYIANLNEY